MELSMVALYENRGEDAVEWATQAQQVDFTQLSGWRARGTRWILPWVLVHTDHIDGAREACEEVLALSRAAGDRPRQADMLWLLAQLARQAGRLPEVGAFLSASAEIALPAGGDWLVLLNILEEGALECAAAGRHAEAVTLWSAFFAHAASAGLVDTPLDRQRREPLMRAARPGAGCAAVAGGRAARRGDDADRGRGVRRDDDRPRRPAPDPPAPRTVTVTAAPGPRLSARERELVALVAQGHTDAEIAAKLFISIRTVRSHLDRIRDKSGCRRRADLTRLALREGIV